MPDSSRPRRKIQTGEIALSAFFHPGAVISNRAGHFLRITEGWDSEKLRALGNPCDQQGNPLNQSIVTLDHPPATAILKTSASSSAWTGILKIVSSSHPGIPSGLTSADPELLVIPFGPHLGKPAGALDQSIREAIAKTAINAKFGIEIKRAETVPEMQREFGPSSSRLSDAAKRDLIRAQGMIVRSIPLVDVIERFCNYAPDEVKGDLRKYRVGSELINLNTKENAFGSLNGYDFKCLNRPRGSRNNSMDMVAAVRELEGSQPDFGRIREELIAHYGLKPQLDALFQQALSNQRAGKQAPLVSNTGIQIADPKSAAEKIDGDPEAEIEFNLATGLPVTATADEISEAAKRGGGFLSRDDLWPKAKHYLCDVRGLDPEVIDYLHDAGQLYASRRTFPPNPRYPHRPNFQDVIVAPIMGFTSDKVVGVDTKPIPKNDTDKTNGRNHGKTSQGAFMFGQWGPEVKRVIVTESFIKGIAFYQLHRDELKIGEETCILCRSGAKPSTEIIPLLKEWGAEAIVANDNDYVGREKAEQFKKACDEAGVKCSEMFVGPSEVTLAIAKKESPGYHDKSRIVSLEKNLTTWADSQGIAYARVPETESQNATSIRLPNTKEVIFKIEEIMREERQIRNAQYQEVAKNASQRERSRIEKSKWVTVQLHGKDWDEVLKEGPPKLMIPSLKRDGQDQNNHPVQHQTSLAPHRAPSQQKRKWALIVKRPNGADHAFSVASSKGIMDIVPGDGGNEILSRLCQEQDPPKALVQIERSKGRILRIETNSETIEESKFSGMTLQVPPKEIVSDWNTKLSRPYRLRLEALENHVGREADLPHNSPSNEIH